MSAATLRIVILCASIPTLAVAGRARAKDPIPAKPAPKEAAPATENKDRVDLYGDPLPAGAVLRLGTTRFRYGDFGIAGFRFLPDGKTLVLAPNGSRAIQFWEARTGKLVREIPLGTLPVRAFAISHDGKYFAVAGFLFDSGVRPWPEEIRIWETESGKEVRTIKRKDSDIDHCSLVFSPDNKLLMSLGRKGILRIEEISTGVELLNHQFPSDILSGLALQTFPTEGGFFTGLAISPDSKQMLMSAYGKQIHVKQPDGTESDIDPPNHPVTIYELPSGKVTDRIQLPGHSSGPVAFSGDGKLFAEAGYEPDSPIRILDTAKGEQVGVIKGFRGHVRRLAFTPDGKRLISGMSDTSALVWDLSEAVVKEK